MKKQIWVPLNTSQEVREALFQGRHVEFTACGCEHDLPGYGSMDSSGWIIIRGAEENADLIGEFDNKEDFPNDRWRYLKE